MRSLKTGTAMAVPAAPVPPALLQDVYFIQFMEKIITALL